MSEKALFQIWQKDYLSTVLSEMFWNFHVFFQSRIVLTQVWFLVFVVGTGSVFQ